jgi:DNA-binding transcriptional ArsR family regulator
MRSALDEFSPKKIADTFEGVSLQLISYHVRILRDAGLLELSRTEPRRGALEHFYRASGDAAQRLSSLGETLTTLGDELQAQRPKPKAGARKKTVNR